MKIYTKKSALPRDWQGAGILLVINVLMIFYITSRKTTIVPSQSLDSVQQQHACKDVRKFFILPKKSLYRPQNYNNNPQKPNNPQQNIKKNEKSIFLYLDEIVHSFIHRIKREHLFNPLQSNSAPKKEIRC